MEQLDLISKRKQAAAHYCLEGRGKRNHCDFICNLEQQETRNSQEKPEEPENVENMLKVIRIMQMKAKRRYTTLKKSGTSLVVQWLGIRLPMQGTQVRALVWEDPTCHGATKPVRHNY